MASCERTEKNGQPVIVLTHASGAVAEVYEHGATVTRYVTAKGAEVLWVSSGAVFNGAKAIRGGIPVVFPMFGPKADKRVGCIGEPLPQHASVGARGECVVVLTLASTPSTLARWPHDFQLEYTVVLDGASLHTALKATNLDSPGAAAVPFAPQALLHTYFTTPDIAKVQIHGLTDATFTDSLDGSKAKTDEGPATCFEGEVDRIYAAATRRDEPLMLRDPNATAVRVDSRVVTLDAEDTITADLPTDVVVWNPHVAKAKGMSDFDDDGWMRMFCVEPGYLGLDRPAVPSKHSIVLSQTITLDE